MIVSSGKLIKSKNLIEVDSEKRFITDEERDFLIGIFDKYFTYGFKIIKSLDSSFNIIRYILNYISEYYGLPNDKWCTQYVIKITEENSIDIIGV